MYTGWRPPAWQVQLRTPWAKHQATCHASVLAVAMTHHSSVMKESSCVYLRQDQHNILFAAASCWQRRQRSPHAVAAQRVAQASCQAGGGIMVGQHGALQLAPVQSAREALQRPVFQTGLRHALNLAVPQKQVPQSGTGISAPQKPI